jgi:15-cis-phytoene synthase
VAPVPAYLEKVESKGAAALDRPVDISPVRRHWIMLRHAMRGWG